MTLYTSNKNQLTKRGILIYLGITVFCLLFSNIYEYFSHNVYSGFMVFLASIPFAGGLLPLLLIRLTSLPFPGRFAENAYHCGIATLTVGCCLTGVFEIYGSVSNLVKIYWIAGTLLCLLGIVTYTFSCMIVRHPR